MIDLQVILETMTVPNMYSKIQQYPDTCLNEMESYQNDSHFRSVLNFLKG